MRCNINLFVSGILCAIAFQQQGCNDAPKTSNGELAKSQVSGAVSLVGNPPNRADANAPVDEDSNLDAIQTRHKLEVLPPARQNEPPPPSLPIVVEEEAPADEDHRVYNLERKPMGITFEWKEGRQASERLEQRRNAPLIPEPVIGGVSNDHPDPLPIKDEDNSADSDSTGIVPPPVDDESSESPNESADNNSHKNSVENGGDACYKKDSEIESPPVNVPERVKRNTLYESDDYLDHWIPSPIDPNGDSRWIGLVGTRLFELSLKTSSQELWNSFGGPEMIQIVNKELSSAYPYFIYERMAGLLMLASELALLPTKVGMTQFDIDSPEVQKICVEAMTHAPFLLRLEESMQQRKGNRLSKSVALGYNYEFVFSFERGDSVYQKHPLANVPVVCSITNDVVRMAILNHRIGRHLHYEVVNQHPDFHLNFHTIDFGIYSALHLIRHERPERLLYGVTKVSYSGQAALGPGTVRDWFGKMIQKVFDRDNKFFVLPETKSEEWVYRINVSSAVDTTLNDCWRSIGRLFAMSLIDGIPLGIVMNRGIYQIPLGKTDNWTDEDLRWDHQGLHNSWSTTVNYKGVDVSELSLSVKSLDQQRNLILSNDDSFSSSSNEIDLTNENIKEWSKLAIDDYMYGKARNAYTEIVNGFYELLPRNIFDGLVNADHLRDILRGELNAKQIIAAMTYWGYTTNSQLIKWLHEVLLKADDKFLSNFLFFSTGLRALPFGFGTANSGNIQVQNEGEGDDLPRAHTCSFTIGIPEYPEKSILEKKLAYAILSHDMERT